MVNKLFAACAYMELCDISLETIGILTFSTYLFCNNSMKRICLFLFSGTGITKYVVDTLINEFKKKQIFVDLFIIESTYLEHIEFDTYQMLGIAYPVHSFNAPKIVIDFAKKIPMTNKMEAFIISTAGGDSFLNNSSSRLLIQILKNKNFNVFFDKQYIMPSNFILKDDKTIVQNKIIAVNIEKQMTVDKIVNCISYRQKENIVSKLIAIIGRLEWVGLRIVQRIFYVNKDCIRCEMCIKNCPKNNIALTEKSLTFKRKCMLCMRCLYLCPIQCIKAKRVFKFIIFDKWYENKEFSIIKEK